LKTTLQKFGLTDKEVEIYLTLLKLGPVLASSITRHTKIARSTVYTCLESLKQKGLITTREQHGSTFFAALEPAILTTKCKENVAKSKKLLQEMEETLPLLESLESKLSTKPKVSLYEGASGIKTIYNDTLQSKTDIKTFIPIHTLPKQLKDYLTKQYVKERVKAKVKTKAIICPTKRADQYRKLDKKHLRESIVLPKGTELFESEIALYDEDKVAIISFKDDLIGIIIRNRPLHKTLEIVFDTLWSTTKK
jgi:HTH-type transcriptional regulator, sugar sensing transcriptional regulator